MLPLDLSAPTSVSSTVYDLLARFWKHALPNPAPDAALPVDGLPDAAERDRAERAGWSTREFTLSLDAAVELIAREVPFFVTLVEAGFSQARLCIGADAIRGTVFLADGMDRRPVEAPVAGSDRTIRGVRPALPGARPGRTMPRSSIGCVYRTAHEREALYAVQKPLLAHDRAKAVAAFEKPKSGPSFRTRASRPRTRQVIRGTRAGPLRRASGQDARVLRRAARLASARADVGSVEGGRPPRTEPAAGAAGAPGDRRDRHRRRAAGRAIAGPGVVAEPAIVRKKPADCSGGRCAVVRSPRPATTCSRRSGGKNADSTTLPKSYRFACTLDDREDQFAEAYFRAARATEQVPEALRLFQQKAGRAAIPAPAATRALFHAPDGPRRAGTGSRGARSGDQEASGDRSIGDRRHGDRGHDSRIA